MKEVLSNAEAKMERRVQHLVTEFSEIRAGRANPNVLDKVFVDYYGAPTAINQLAAVSVAEARVLVIQPWDVSVCNLIEKAIQKSELGINPQNDGKVIRLVFPSLTEESRKELVKTLNKKTEDAKVNVRNIRRDILEVFKKQKKDGTLTEDDMKNVEKDVQKVTDDAIKEIETIAANKEKAIMAI
jgi:ribosome recycling factor